MTKPLFILSTYFVEIWPKLAEKFSNNVNPLYFVKSNITQMLCHPYLKM